MRQVGVIGNIGLANRFADYLRANGIDCTVDQTPNGGMIWVHDDDRVAEAKSQLPDFLANPEEERYLAAAHQVMNRARQSAARLAAARKQTIYVSDRWNRSAAQTAPITVLLIALSVVTALSAGLPPNMDLIKWMFISTNLTLRQVTQGEVWRLVTPIFIHFSPMHLIFNMLNFWYLGQMIEARIGSWRYLGIILATAIAPNVAQFLAGGPIFGGMSGVVYGLFGYIWVKAKMDPESGFWMPQSTVTIMGVWYILCVFGIIPNVANWCHGVGLAMGVAIAFTEVTLKPILRRK